MPISKSLLIVNLTLILKTFWIIYIRDRSEQEIWFQAGLKVLLGLKYVISGKNWFFRWDCDCVGLWTPLRTDTSLMSNVEKSRFNLSDRGVFICFLIFYLFLSCYLRGTFLFNNQHQLSLMLLRCAFLILNMEISIMLWRVAVGVHTFR